MGLLDKATHRQYYQSTDLGNYQFTSLDDIITQFEIAYVGENKLISKIKRADIAFHAQRALQELSFDTLKSLKSYQIDLPPTLVMPLPHDYVNYTKVSWADSSGIKRPLYPTKHTSNPFQIKQLDNGDYSFPDFVEQVINGDFANSWPADGTTAPVLYADDWLRSSDGFLGRFYSGVGVYNDKLTWSYVSRQLPAGGRSNQIITSYQAIDVSNLNYVDLSGDGVTGDIAWTDTSGDSGTATSTIRLGLTTTNPSSITNFWARSDFSGENQDGSIFYHYQSPLAATSFYDMGYVEWTGAEDSTKTLGGVDVRSLDTIYVLALSFVNTSLDLINALALIPAGTSTEDPNAGTITGGGHINSLDNVSIINAYASEFLATKVGNEKNSSTWNTYKSTTPSENNNDDYEDNTYWPMDGERYGLDPQHAQANGSFYIDPRLGRIHFSSNISGKTVILDYISDSLGTDAEMQVHKFAEEAIYKWIAYAILSTSSLPIHQQLAPRFKKEKFASTRQAKLRLSNIKLEELTQILRGKSKQIKH